ncbi:hypothetical protein [Bradyrhizobium sp. LTSP857]|uniref:hypothetical protein n=1 Tax=Bradyrhizobium sp. LTSP857 TaxID=1619231 RepID=UPI0005D28B9E|nr:hypothetical protein [Bradyrhizobium sp. LTSP857]KJC34402.1 hypothetical protein UP06_33235 [Bradyrhizobium sp. LTSP857]
MTDERRAKARVVKPSYDQNMRNLSEQLEVLDEQLVEIEARLIVQEHCYDLRQLKNKLRRKMN